MNNTYDIAIVGSGFGGSLLAMIAHQLGRSVILLEKGKHPRFAIGESSTPLSNILLEHLTTRYRLPNLTPLSKWGSWQKTNPQVACGLKRGFTFYHHTLGAPPAPDPQHQRQLLVAASPHDGIADTHWYRADVDHFLVQQAQQVGVPYFDEVNPQDVAESDSEIRVTGRRGNKEFSIGAQFLVDATGPRGFLHRSLDISELELPDFPATQALFSHFIGVGQIAEGVLAEAAHKPPYPVDNAAVHHVFEGGWIWVLKFNNGITSAGVAATDELAERLRFSEGEPAWDRLLDLLPAVKEQFAKAKANRPFTHMPRVAFRSKHIAGKRWAMLPSAAGFVDPLLSSGFPLTLLGVSRLAEIIEEDWDTPRFPGRLNTYAVQTGSELVDTGRLIASMYATMDRFPLFVSLSMLYFAAASFSEAARRLGKPYLARSFLLGDNQHFHVSAQRCFEHAREAFTEDKMREVSQEVAEIIGPINIAGLGNAARHNWYPVDANDLLDAAAKLASTKEEIKEVLEKCGFWK
ncbi:MAG: tryptophan 7-halogenase [Candidatus Acidiferrum sp.]